MAEEKKIKNKDKWLSYQVAYSMINAAIKNDCPLQAITIEESILADRLWSVLHVGMAIKEENELGTLGKALREWNKEKNENAKLFDQEMESLRPLIADWWHERNALIHGIAKSYQGRGPEIKAEEFRSRASKAAKEGLCLANKVKDWVQKKTRLLKRRKTNA